MWQKITNYFRYHWSGLSRRQQYGLAALLLILITAPLMALAWDLITLSVLKILTSIISVLVYFLGQLLAVLIHILVWVAQYNNFINEQVVTEGWKVVRDVCNMFFVLGLLIIAFGTVLRIPNYQAKGLLRNFILGAIMVNFSKTICGLILDFAQIIMLTFVNGFKDVGAGNLTQMLGLTQLFDVVSNGSSSIEGIGIFVSYLLAFVYLIVAFVVILTMVIMLIQRAVMLWIYVVLSPFPWLLSALPKTGKLGASGARWWSEFTGLVVTGPMLAFFIWLSFFTASGSGVSQELIGGTADNQIDPNQGTNMFSDINAGVTSSGTAQAIIKFLVSIGLLWGGMMVTKEASSMLGKTVGGGISRLDKLGKWANPVGRATDAVKNTAKWTGRNTLKGVGGLSYAITKNSNSKVGQTFQKLGQAGMTWGSELTDARQKEKVKKRLDTLKKIGLGVGDKTMAKFKDVADDDGIKTVAKTIKTAGRVAAGTAMFNLAAPTLGLMGAPLLATMAKGAGVSLFASAAGKAPFSKQFGRFLQQSVKGSDIEKNENAYDEYHKKVNEARDIMDSTRKTARKNYEEGKINGSEYIEQRKNAINKYNDDKNTAYKDLILAQKIIAGKPASQTEIDELNKIRKTKSDTINKAKADYQKSSRSKEDLKKRDTAIYEANGKYKKERDELGFKDNRSSEWKRFAAWLAVGTGIKNLGQGMQNYHPLQLFSSAADLFRKDTNDAKEIIKDISGITDPSDLVSRLKPNIFSGGLKNLENKHIKTWQVLVDPAEANSQQAIDNLVGAVGNMDETKDKKLIESIMKGLSTFEKSGGGTARLSNLKTELDTKSTKTYSQYLADAKSVKLRQIDQSTIGGDGAGSLSVQSFAAGKKDVNVIGADFSKLSSLDEVMPDPNLGVVAGANIAPEKMAAVASELTGLIDDELATLQQAGVTMVNEPLDSLEQKITQLRSQRSEAFKVGNIGGAEEFMPELQNLSRVRDLRVAKNRLANPTALNNLSLKNTGVSMVSQAESQTTLMHEALHGYGLDDESLTESVAKQMAGGSYKLDDAAAIAQRLKNIMAQKNISQSQLSDEDITKAIGDIKPMSKVDEVITKEAGAETTIINNINNNIQQSSTSDKKIMEGLRQQDEKTDASERQRVYHDYQARDTNKRIKGIQKSINKPGSK